MTVERFSPIAIVGAGCVLPGALGPDALWELVRDGKSALSRGDHRFGTAIGGYVRGFENVFDDAGYLVSPDELRGLDPVFLWTVHAAREALRSAGIALAPNPRGAFVLGNLSYPTPLFGRFASELRSSGHPRVDPRNRFMSGLPAGLAAQAVGFGAGAFALDAACASSLYAVKLACDRLHDRSADVALAGGVNHTGDTFLHAGFMALAALSPTGQSRPFHRDADGLVPAQGAAMVVLKRLADAEANGDVILGVIRGIGLSNDGRSRGLLVPAEEGQLRAVRAAYAMSDLRPADISLVECHATGTQIGDACEVRGLNQIFDGVSDVPIGSVKGNLGHLVTAAGAAALLKVLWAMREKVRPPTLHSDDPLDELRSGPLRLLRQAESWDGPRRAAISAFGFGGNNAHLLVEEYSKSPASARVPELGRRAEIAIIAKAAVVGPLGSARELDRAILAGKSLLSDEVREVAAEPFELDVAALRSPPADLRETLAQQNLMLRLAPEVAPVVARAPSDRVMLLVGMQIDGEVSRSSLKVDQAVAARDSKTPLTSAETVGCMPNIVANRLSRELDLRGPCFSVSAEEASGTIALDLAVRSLSAHEVDLAVVGAVDLSCESVHREAAAALLPPDRAAPGDAALLFVLKRLDDARRDGDEVLAVLTNDEGTATHELSLDRRNPGLSSLFGHAHAASGLLHVAAAVTACERRALPATAGLPAMPWLPTARERRARVDVRALGGTSTSTVLRSEPRSRVARDSDGPCLVVFGGTDRDALIRALERREPTEPSDHRVAIAASTAAELDQRIDRAIESLRQSDPGPFALLGDGMFYGSGPLPGELAFVFTGPAGAYPHMGRDLALALPELVDGLSAKSSKLGERVGFIYDSVNDFKPETVDKLFSSAFLAALHAELTHGLLGIRPHASIGYCSGETNALFALGAWKDFDRFRVGMDESGVFTRELAGDLLALRRAWSTPSGAPIGWSTYRALVSPDTLREALAGESRVHLSIINGPNDVIFAGDPEGCARVTARLGGKAKSLGYDMVMHCPEARAFEAEWRALHRRPTTPVPGVRFYTHASCSSYELSDDAAADALTGQAMSLVNFPALVERAYEDGVRIFVEHGPHAGCTKWIGEVLGTRPHLAVPLDRFGCSSLVQAVTSIAALVAAGVPMDHAALLSRLGPALRQEPRRASRPMRFEAHPPPPAVVEHKTEQPGIETMAPAPKLPSPTPRAFRNGGGNGSAPSVVTEIPTASPHIAALVAHQARLAELHTEFLRQQADVQARFLAVCLGTSLPVPTPTPSPAPPPPRAPDRPKPVVAEPTSKRRTPTGPTFDRAQLETLASGKISSVFGPMFEKQDDFVRQVRMPEPPLLLADRVTGLEGEPGSMGKATIWTETDVTPDAFYLHEGRMPAGIFVESGQADLLLVSWLGIDFKNKSERVYRLLGCELTSFGGHPRIGDKLQHEIRIDGHMRQGDVHLCTFSSECYIDGELRLQVRNGQAGFFTDEELASSAGIRWEPETATPIPATNPRLAPPVLVSEKSSFSKADLDAFAEGRAHECFGPGFERAATHTRTPTIQSGQMRLIDDVVSFDPSGGPWKRGTLRARYAIRPDHWFFPGHFKNDPCMPGTLMVEGGLQAMAIYLAALGHTLRRDGWRFEVVPHETYQLRCRGQTTPASKEMIYDLFVHEVVCDPYPTIFADVLGTVDGLKAFHLKRLGLRLVPGWPFEEGRMKFEPPAQQKPCASAHGIVFDERFMMKGALGRPSDGYGEEYKRFDQGRMPRSPNPPYLFMSRVVELEGEAHTMKPGSSAVIEYDIPPDAWYLDDNGRRVVPLAALLEIAVQPCGWLAGYTGCVLAAADEVSIRNLDGSAKLHREIPDSVRTLSTKVTSTSVSQVGALTIVGFDLAVYAADELVYEADTTFGFFTQEALAHQVGLPTSDAERAKLDDPSSIRFDVRDRAFPGIARRKLLMIDRVSGLWPDGGKAGLGRIRTEKDIRATDWFFKAHFFQDPVQPGSLGLDGMQQSLQVLMLEQGLASGLSDYEFDTANPDVPMVWKYRGQVVPENDVVTIDLEITELRDNGRVAIAEGSLYVDGKRIYHCRGITMRIGAKKA